MAKMMMLNTAQRHAILVVSYRKQLSLNEIRYNGKMLLCCKRRFCRTED